MKPTVCPRCGELVTVNVAHSIGSGTCKPRNTGGSGPNSAQQVQPKMRRTWVSGCGYVYPDSKLELVTVRPY